MEHASIDARGGSGMSFYLFVYYCSLVGAWTGIFGWAVGRVVSERVATADNLILQDGIRGLALGAMVAFGLGLVDALWNVGWRRILEVLARLWLAVAIGAFGGFVGGAGAQWLVSLFGNAVPTLVFFVVGWTVAGLLVGAAIAAFERLGARDVDSPARPKFRKCSIGGGVGGLCGGLASHYLREGWLDFFQDKDATQLWSPTAVGFVTLGLFIGLLVGLAQVVLKQAWIRVEAGFRPGRELILSRSVTRIGRGETCEIALFGDGGVEKLHAQIVRDGVGYVVEDAESAGGTFLNDKRVKRPTPLRSGDLIRVGKSVLRFSNNKR
jgi:hypothetical protein